MSYGAAHNEVMWVNNEPVLIEINARLMGASIDKESFVLSLGYTQAELLASMYANYEWFLENFANKKYQLMRSLSEISLIFERSGKLKSFFKKNEIQKLDSFHSFCRVPEIGSEVLKTMDTLGDPGYIYLSHQDSSVVESDMQQILQWQREDALFEIVPLL